MNKFMNKIKNAVVDVSIMVVVILSTAFITVSNKLSLIKFSRPKSVGK